MGCGGIVIFGGVRGMEWALGSVAGYGEGVPRLVNGKIHYLAPF
jgi:hypothetical protein